MDNRKRFGSWGTIASRLMLLVLGTCSVMMVQAQRLMDVVPDTSDVEMATGMRSSGKIYVVVAVLAIVLIGLFLYLISLDRKITKLEKDS